MSRSVRLVLSIPFAVLLGLVVAPVSGAQTSGEEAASLIQFGRIQYNAVGADTSSNASLNGEWVQITNRGTTSRSLTSWTLRDLAGHVYKFGSFSLGAGRTVYVHTGSGFNNASHRYQFSRAHIWNNTGDAAYLRNASGVLADACSWGNGPGFKYC